ncbi:MAG: tyrosine-type recombinase/integrase [Candidatus Obscuribacterales bacterium]|nr:tyrosine-type recombinase/integrase [Candidatus Obscuribacterales bacterium]
MNSDLDIRKLIEFAKTLDPETIKSNPKLAILLNLESVDCPNLQLAASLKERFDRYRKETKRTGLSAHTKRSYLSRINSFTGWLSTAEDDYSDFFQDIDCRSRAALAYKEHLQDRCSESPNTVNAFLTTLTHFCSVLNLEPPSLKHESRKHHRLRRLSNDDQNSLLQAADQSRPQARAIIYLLLKVGLRGSECWSLNTSDHDKKTKTISIRRPGETDRIFSLDAKSNQVLQDWLTIRKDKVTKPQKAIFVNPQGHRLSEVSLRKIVRKVGQKASLGIDIQPTVLRQTCLANRIIEERENRGRKSLTAVYKDVLESLCNQPPDMTP